MYNDKTKVDEPDWEYPLKRVVHEHQRKIGDDPKYLVKRSSRTSTDEGDDMFSSKSGVLAKRKKKASSSDTSDESVMHERKRKNKRLIKSRTTIGRITRSSLTDSDKNGDQSGKKCGPSTHKEELVNKEDKQRESEVVPGVHTDGKSDENNNDSVDADEVVKGRATNKEQMMEEQELEVDNGANEKAVDAGKDISMGGTKDNSTAQKTVHKGKATGKLAGKGVSRRQGQDQDEKVEHRTNKTVLNSGERDGANEENLVTAALPLTEAEMPRKSKRLMPKTDEYMSGNSDTGDDTEFSRIRKDNQKKRYDERKNDDDVGPLEDLEGNQSFVEEFSAYFENKLARETVMRDVKNLFTRTDKKSLLWFLQSRHGSQFRAEQLVDFWNNDRYILPPSAEEWVLRFAFPGNVSADVNLQ